MNTNFKWLDEINYKDIIIIYSLWFFALFSNRYISFTDFITVPNLSGFVDLSFNFVTRFIFVSLIFTYFIFLYDLSFSDLGISFKIFFKNTLKLIIYIIFLVSLVILLINMPLSIKKFSGVFDPIYKITQFPVFVRSIFAFIVVSPLYFIIAFSEQLMLNIFVYEIFNYKIPRFLSKILSGLFFSFLIYRLQADKIIIYFVFAIISITLYERSQKNLLVPSFFGAGFYIVYSLYIYGWHFI